MLPDPEALTIRAGNASGFLFQGFPRPLYLPLFGIPSFVYAGARSKGRYPEKG